MMPPPANPLRPLHESSAETLFQPYGPIEIVSTFGQPEAEYAAVRKGAALMDLPQRGVIEATGKDRLEFINNLITNPTWDFQTRQGMPAGSAVYAYLINLKGRIVADMNVIELGDKTLIETDVRLIDAIIKGFSRYLFSEQVKLTARTAELHRMALHGPESFTILRDAGAAIEKIEPMSAAPATLLGIETILFRDDECGVPGHHLIVPAERAAEIWTKLTNQFANPLELGRRRLRPMGWAAYNACRIEAGRPLFDIDFGNSADPEQSNLPAETGQFDRAVSVTKGCYLGQEIVARMHARGQSAKQLVGLRIEGDALPVAGAAVYDAGHAQIGAITSSTMSPILSNAPIALAILKRPHYEVGTSVIVPAENAMHRAKVVALPFI